MNGTTEAERMYAEQLAKQIGDTDWVPLSVELTLKLVNDADRLAQYESQCIPRTADMPEWAVGWGKDAEENCVWMRNRTELDSDVPGLPEIVVARMRSQAGEEDMPVPAPDLLPDEPGPVYRHIGDVE